jgi:hypothetical protein
MSGQFLGALLILGLFVENRIRLQKPGERLRSLSAGYDEVYHGEPCDQFRTRPRRKQCSRGFRYGYEHRAAVAGYLAEPPRVNGEQRIE